MKASIQLLKGNKQWTANNEHGNKWASGLVQTKSVVFGRCGGTQLGEYQHLVGQLCCLSEQFSAPGFTFAGFLPLSHVAVQQMNISTAKLLMGK